MPNFDRLTKIADLIEREIDKGGYRFDLKNWGYTHDCGTTACAIGLAVANRFEGLIDYCDGFCPAYIDADKKLKFGWDAVRALFDIETAVAHYFFDYSEYPQDLQVGPESAKEVVRRIRAFVNVESDLRSVKEVITDPRSITEIRKLEMA